MDALSLIARNAMQGALPFTGPVFLRFCAYMPVPKFWRKVDKALALSGARRPVGKPDLSNVQKLIEDAILPASIPKKLRANLTPEQIYARKRQPGAVIIDDSQVVQVQAWKFYSADPRVVVEVIELNEMPSPGGQAHGAERLGTGHVAA